MSSIVAVAVSVLAEYPRSSNMDHWHTGTMSTQLNRFGISSAISSLTCSFVLHSLIVPSHKGGLTFIVLGILVSLSSQWMEATTFLFTSFRRIYLSFLPLPLFHFRWLLRVGT